MWEYEWFWVMFYLMYYNEKKVILDINNLDFIVNRESYWLWDCIVLFIFLKVCVDSGSSGKN